MSWDPCCLSSSYLNDVADCISGGSKINLFADDIALYRIITNPDDYLTLQADVNAIKSTLTTKYLMLNPKSTAACSFLVSEFIQYHHLT